MLYTKDYLFWAAKDLCNDHCPKSLGAQAVALHGNILIGLFIIDKILAQKEIWITKTNIILVCQ